MKSNTGICQIVGRWNWRAMMHFLLKISSSSVELPPDRGCRHIPCYGHHVIHRSTATGNGIKEAKRYQLSACQLENACFAAFAQDVVRWWDKHLRCSISSIDRRLLFRQYPQYRSCLQPLLPPIESCCLPFARVSDGLRGRRPSTTYTRLQPRPLSVVRATANP